MAGQTLRICEYNLENLFLSMEYYEGQDLEHMTEDEWRALALAQLRRKQKPLAKIWGVAQAILDIDPEILMMTEVGGQESLENLNRHFLGDRFVPYFVEGNSRRSIDLGFLVRRDLPFRVEARSNRDTPVEVYTMQGKYTAKFSRDVAELRLHDPESDQLRLILLLTHLKSKLSTERDLQGKDVRTGEAMALAAHYQGLRASLPDVPVVVGGDFNASLSSLELELLAHTDLTDFHDLISTPEEERTTLVHFDGAGKPQRLVLDYLLVSPDLRNRVVPSESCTYRYKGFYEMPDPLPDSISERMRMPSDHYPLVLTLNDA